MGVGLHSHSFPPGVAVGIGDGQLPQRRVLWRPSQGLQDLFPSKGRPPALGSTHHSVLTVVVVCLVFRQLSDMRDTDNTGWNLMRLLAQVLEQRVSTLSSFLHDLLFIRTHRHTNTRIRNCWRLSTKCPTWAASTRVPAASLLFSRARSLFLMRSCVRILFRVGHCRQRRDRYAVQGHHQRGGYPNQPLSTACI
jgi:hypothetical protein